MSTPCLTAFSQSTSRTHMSDGLQGDRSAGIVCAASSASVVDSSVASGCSVGGDRSVQEGPNAPVGRGCYRCPSPAGAVVEAAAASRAPGEGSGATHPPPLLLTAAASLLPRLPLVIAPGPGTSSFAPGWAIARVLLKLASNRPRVQSARLLPDGHHLPTLPKAVRRVLPCRLIHLLFIRRMHIGRHCMCIHSEYCLCSP